MQSNQTLNEDLRGYQITLNDSFGGRILLDVTGKNMEYYRWRASKLLAVVRSSFIIENIKFIKFYHGQTKGILIEILKGS